jgi:hypothetical protein
LKEETIKEYGGKCFCCGESSIIFLTIDHIHNNGSEERKRLKLRGAGIWFYEWLKKKNWPKEDYQIACFNCNIGRYQNGGICPHQTILGDYMSDYGKDHTKKKSVKSYEGQIGSTPMSGTKDRPAHKHPDKMVALGEGLGMGSVHSNHTKGQVHMAKHNPTPHKEAHAMRAKAIAGKAGTMGEGSVTNQKTGHGALMSSLADNKVRNKAFGFNKRSEQGGANPSAFADGNE